MADDDLALQADLRLVLDRASAAIAAREAESIVQRVNRTFAGAQQGLLGGLGGIGVGRLGLQAGGALVALEGLQRASQFIGDSIQAASNLNETITASQAIFGDASAGVLAFGDAADTALGLSNRAALESVNQFGSLFRNMELGQEVAAQLGQEFTALGVDIASLFNASNDEAQRRLFSGLVGETEAVRRYGIDVSAAAVEQRAFALDVADSAQELDAQQKALIRALLIIEQTEVAHGDFQRTIGSLANQQRILTGEVEDFQAELGELLEQPAQEFVAFLRDVVDFGRDAAAGIELVTEKAAGLRDALPKPVRDALLTLTGTDEIEKAQERRIKEDAERARRRAGLSDLASNLAAGAFGVDDLDAGATGTILKALEDSKGAEEDSAAAAEELAKARSSLRDSSLDAVQAELAYADALAAIEDAEDRVVDAERRLQRVRDQRARQAHEIARAELGLRDAQLGVTESHQALFEAEFDAGIAQDTGDVLEQRRANVELERAKLGVEQASLNVKDAEFGLSDARQRAIDLDREVADAADGVNDAYARVGLATEAASLASIRLSDANDVLLEGLRQYPEAAQQAVEALDVIAARFGDAAGLIESAKAKINAPLAGITTFDLNRGGIAGPGNGPADPLAAMAAGGQASVTQNFEQHFHVPISPQEVAAETFWAVRHGVF